MREEEKSIVKLLNLDCGLFYTNRSFTLSNPIFDDGELKLEKYSDDLLAYKPNKNNESSLEAWGIFEQTFSTLNIQSSKPQRKTFNLSENDIGLLIPILIIEYCGKPNVTFQSIINMASQSNEPDFLWIGEFFAKKVLVGGTLVIKDAFRYSYNSLEQLKLLIIKSVNKFRYANKNLSKEIIVSKRLLIHIEDFDGNLLKNTEMLDTYIQQLYEFNKATVITYEEMIPTYIFLDTEKQPKWFNKRLVPGISTYHEECSMGAWLGIQQLIRERKLEHGLIAKSNEFISSLYPAVELEFEPSIKLLNTATKLNISHLSTQKELFYINSRIDIFNNKFNLLDKMPFVTVNHNSQINSLHCDIICEKIEMDIKDVINPSQQLEIEVEEALEKNNPYKELEKVFAKYGHVFCIKFSMGGILTKLNEFPLTESEIKNVSNNKFEDFESHQETLNAWINLLDQFKMDKNMYILEKSLSHVRNDYNAIVVSNDNIVDWEKSVSKNLDTWQVVNRQLFIPLYKLFNNSLQKEIDFLLSNENRILMTGISKLKNNEIRYYYEKFNQPLESDEYQVIGSIVSDGLEDVNLIVSFQMLTVSGFSIIIEELDNKSSMKSIAKFVFIYIFFKYSYQYCRR
ncbi:chitin synthase regulatory factor chr2 [Gigaspora margarita]|uniref:Chitin synthase regulatory factor chr2 n=1 Tax=Gigaspora margarita TaxID=4874 RepID=A0A8H3WXD5_GIGMA|nr:chitin synthase regulatory factor chr2 [Gigaspora margarita]